MSKVNKNTLIKLQQTERIPKDFRVENYFNINTKKN